MTLEDRPSPKAPVAPPAALEDDRKDDSKAPLRSSLLSSFRSSSSAADSKAPAALEDDRKDDSKCGSAKKYHGQQNIEFQSILENLNQIMFRRGLFS